MFPYERKIIKWGVKQSIIKKEFSSQKLCAIHFPKKLTLISSEHDKEIKTAFSRKEIRIKCALFYEFMYFKLPNIMSGLVATLMILRIIS
jgi:hypothetical protein